jgi:hypothetical protein
VFGIDATTTSGIAQCSGMSGTRKCRYALPHSSNRGDAMEKRKPQHADDTARPAQRPARRSTEIQPVKKDDVALETYEQSPERPGGDERNRPATPDGPLPDRERVAPD